MRHLAEHHPIPEFLQELVYSWPPRGWHGRVASVQHRCMPLQPFTQNEIDVKTSVVPVLHHATNLELHRRRRPRVADHWVPSSRLVDILHVIPAGPEHPIVPEAVATPACPAGDRVLERPADGQYQRSPGEISEIPVG